MLVRDPITDQTVFARVKVPTEILPRFVTLKQPAPAPVLLVPLEDVIAHHLDALFPGMEIADYDVFRVTRDADLEVSDDAADLLQAVEDELRRRRFGEIVRVEVGASCSEQLREELDGLLGVQEDEVYPVDGLLDMGALWQIVKLPGHAELREEPLVGITHPRLLRREGERPDVLGAMREGDLLVHHPYVSFATSVERFVEQAVADPNVLAIKQTVYRTSDDSPLVPALIDATERGKQAVALVELQARFDERMNIHWAKAHGGGRRARRLRPARAEDPRQVRAGRAPRGRRGAQLRAHRHRQLPLRDRAPVHRLRPVHDRRADRRRRRRHVQLPHRLRPPAALPQGADRAQPSARGHHRADRADDRRALTELTRADRDEDELARRRALHPRALRGLAGGRAKST